MVIFFPPILGVVSKEINWKHCFQNILGFLIRVLLLGKLERFSMAYYIEVVGGVPVAYSKNTGLNMSKFEL